MVPLGPPVGAAIHHPGTVAKRRTVVTDALLFPCSPLPRDTDLILQPAKRSRRNFTRFSGNLLDPKQNSVAMQGAQRHRLQHQHVHRSFQLGCIHAGQCKLPVSWETGRASGRGRERTHPAFCENSRLAPNFFWLRPELVNGDAICWTTGNSGRGSPQAMPMPSRLGIGKPLRACGHSFIVVPVLLNQPTT